ncbi:MAG: NAD(P)H-binding protein [Solirubrobacterales bacterium]|nr:NAD(P)H-binding protein [Solirubrobacterales bacterium]
MSGATETRSSSATDAAGAETGRILVAGATGYVGRLLSLRLAASERPVRCLVRDRERARDLEQAGCELVEGNVLEPETLGPALDGVEVAYYLVHSMGRGAEDDDFVTRDRKGAEHFGSAAAAAGVGQIIYMGGLGLGDSKHLKSRHETAKQLERSGVPLTYFRAAAVIGGGSESFLTVMYLVKRLPAMVTPKWTTTKTQPIAIGCVLDFLARAPEIGAARGAEIEIGGPTVTTYGGMMDDLAGVMGKRKPLRISVPMLSPGLSARWIGLVTPVDADVAKPLIAGLTVETVVGDPEPMRMFGLSPRPLEQAMREALEEAHL